MPLGMARGPDSREEGVEAGVTLQTPMATGHWKVPHVGVSDWDREQERVGPGSLQ